jgi:hypothetical protein
MLDLKRNISLKFLSVCVYMYIYLFIYVYTQTNTDTPTPPYLMEVWNSVRFLRDTISCDGEKRVAG